VQRHRRHASTAAFVTLLAYTSPAVKEAIRHNGIADEVGILGLLSRESCLLDLARADVFTDAVVNTGS
jgi:hypothetical protein